MSIRRSFQFDLIVVTLIAFYLGSFASLGFAGAGTRTGSSMALPISPRQAALGNAASSLLTGPDALNGNPAALGEIRRPGISAAQSFLTEDVSLRHLAVELPLMNGGGVGVGVSAFDAGAIDQVDDTGAINGRFKPQDLLFLLGLSKNLGSYRVGASLKHLKSQIIDTARVTTVDVSVLGIFRNGDTRFAIIGQNLHGELSYQSESEPLLRLWRFSVGQRVTNRIWLPVEYERRSDRAQRAAAGIEYLCASSKELSVRLRGGYSHEIGGSAPSLHRESIGLGVVFRSLSIDYAWIPLGELGQTQLVGLGWTFKGR